MSSSVGLLRVAHTNARGLNNYQKWKDLMDYMKKEKIDIMTVTETWLQKYVGEECQDNRYLQSPRTKERGCISLFQEPAHPRKARSIFSVN